MGLVLATENSLFVAPVDLLKHCGNLEQVGVIQN